MAVLAVCAWITLPGPVPFTLQTFGVYLAVEVLGGHRGSLAVALYLLLGVAGLPVFAGFSGGLGYLLGATGGYAVGLWLSALTLWLGEHLPPRRWRYPLTAICALLLCYACGTGWYLGLYAPDEGLWGALLLCVLPYILPDGLKILLAHALARRLKPLSKR